MSLPTGSPVAFRGSILHFFSDPGPEDSPQTWQYIEDGLLIVEHGKVKTVGTVAQLLPALPPNSRVVDHAGGLIVPGFVDAHTHYPQVDMIASPGKQLLDWLEGYTFPAERHYADPEVAREAAAFFLDELLRNGTTTALVFGTVHKQSVNAF